MQEEGKNPHAQTCLKQVNSLSRVPTLLEIINMMRILPSSYSHIPMYTGRSRRNQNARLQLSSAHARFFKLTLFHPLFVPD